MPTTLDEEVREQRARWRLTPEARRLGYADELLRGEFFRPAKLRARAHRALRELLGFAAAEVPYYQDAFRAAGLGRHELRARDAIHRVPVLTKELLQQHAEQLRARRLPPGQEIAGRTRTSGTTGQPTVVVHSSSSLLQFGWLKQREYRWFRFDPARTLAAIRPWTELPRPPGSGEPPRGVVMRVGSWPTVGRWFHTGPFIGFPNTNPLDAQLGFLGEHRPAYLIMQAAGIEHLALSTGGSPPTEALQGVQAISQTLTPTMRRTVEEAFGVPVHQNYGLNEVGIVASRCPEGGRYHVHAEHCFVEIVDDAGAPCAPGEEGRVLVTSLTNIAMPLIRYDTDDLATATDGPCPCGRTLPSFGQVRGRYRRIAMLPEGSWERWAGIQLGAYRLPAELSGALRQYQAHEHLDGRWTLRVHATDGLGQAIGEAIRPYFEQAIDGEPPHLEVVATDTFAGKPGAKFQSFLSDHAPAPDEEE